MKQGQIFPSPPHITHLFWDANPEACMSLALMLTKASPVTVYGCPLFDTANTEQAEVQPSHRRPVVHQRETPGSQALSCCSSHPSISLLLPSLPSPACCRLSYRPTCLASPLLPNHYDTLTEWLWTGQDFRGGKVAERKRALRWTDRRREGIFRVVKRVTIDLIICII